MREDAREATMRSRAEIFAVNRRRGHKRRKVDKSFLISASTHSAVTIRRDVLLRSHFPPNLSCHSLPWPSMAVRVTAAERKHTRRPKFRRGRTNSNTSKVFFRSGIVTKLVRNDREPTIFDEPPTPSVPFADDQYLRNSTLSSKEKRLLRTVMQFLSPKGIETVVGTKI